MKQLKDLKLNDTVLTADEVEQKINAAVSGVAPDGELLCATTVCASTVCAGIARANNMFVNCNGALTIGLGPQGQVTGPHLRVTKTQIETSGLNSRGNFAFTLAADKEIQVARIKEVREEIDAKLAEFSPSGGSGVSIDEFNGLKSQVDAKADKAHTHKIEEVGELTAALGGKANAVHNHVAADVEGLGCALDAKADKAHTHKPEDVSGIVVALGGKANAVHKHAVADVEGLDGELDAKADAAHTHSMDDVQGLSLAIDSLSAEIDASSEAKADKVHTHGIPDVSGLTDALAGKQDKLTPGANISIDNGVISATGGSGGTADLTNYYTKTEVDKCVTDAKDEVLGEVAADYYCKTEIDNMVLENLPEHTHEISEVTGLEEALAGKQDTLIAGANISIADDGIISAAGGAVEVDDVLKKDSTNPIQNKWLGLRMGATAYNSVQIGYNAKAGSNEGYAIDGTFASDSGVQVAVGHSADGSCYGTAVGAGATGPSYGTAVGAYSVGCGSGAAVGYYAKGYTRGVAVGAGANGHTNGVAVGLCAEGYCAGVAVGHCARGYCYGVAIGQCAVGIDYSVAIGVGVQASDDTPIIIGSTCVNYTKAQITVSKAGVMAVGGTAVAMASALAALEARVAALEAQ